MLNIVIEAFRGLAASWVFLFHMNRPSGSHLLTALADIGHLGVPMFFVISGYCIGGSARITARRGESATAFLWRRFCRIYPPLWASMLVVIALPFLLALLSSLHTRHLLISAPAWMSYSMTDWVETITLVRVFFSHEQHPEVAFSAF